MKNYKKAAAGCLALALAMSLAPVSIFAETEQAETAQAETADKNAGNKKCGDKLDWELNGDTLTISGTGDMYDLYDNGGAITKYTKPWLHSESQIKHVVIEEGVTSIGANAFQLCTVLEDVSIPSTVTKIGFGAFQDCKALTEVTVHNGVIGESAFIRCTSLRTVNIGAGVTNMGISAFENCNALEEVHINDMAAWCKIDFGGIYANPLQKAHHLYLNGSLVTDITIPEGITEIRNYAFIDDQDFTSVSIPSTVTKIGNHAFFNDKGITTVNVPSKGLTSIGDCAFQGCSSLVNLSIPSTVSYIGSYCFAFNPLTEINVNGGYIGDHAFYGCGAAGYAALGDEVSYIGESAFGNCAGISNLDLGYYVSYIGDNAFSGCDNLVARGLVEYGGTADTWGKIQLGSGNDCLTGAKKIVNKNRGTSMAPVITPKQEVVFGRYEQDNNTENGAEDIVWYVLDVQGDKALIVSRDVLDFKQYAESIKPYDIPWEDSELRSWLNGSFYSSAFNDSERAAIYSTTLKNDPNPVYGTDGGAATTDNVFILSTAEAQRYFANDAQRRSCATAKARASSGDSALYHDDFKSSYWWLRNPGLFGYAAMFTHYNGAPVYDGMAGANTIGGVRPAMWVDKDSVKAEEDKVSEFVDRLYYIILDRHAETEGLADWTNELKNGRATSADIVYGLANSQEFTNKGLTNDEIVERMYMAMLGRASDEGGKADWLNAMANGCTVNGIINGFSGSQEFADICAGYSIKAGNISTCEPRDKNVNLTAFVSRMYTKALNRAYDVSGLNDWTGDYLDGKATADKIAYGFILSQEFEGRNLSDEAYVDTLYRTFFDREPDEGGKAGWLSELANGTSRKDVLDGFLGAQEFVNLKKSFGV